ncbi:MAG TPA: hypothetical protein VMW64_01300 [Dehalococcoidia bacterium]|nr:hypothetical protein [Dehalococcoidia bacterium]
MGTRDFRHHEHKKPKKGAKKPLVTEVLSMPTTVEVIKAKGKKDKSEWWEEKSTEEGK